MQRWQKLTQILGECLNFGKRLESRASWDLGTGGGRPLPCPSATHSVPSQQRTPPSTNCHPLFIMVILEDPKVSWIRDRPCLYIYFEKTLGDGFELWCWRRLLRIPWTSRRSNQSVLKEISPEYWSDWCWSWLSSTLATWLIRKDPDAGKGLRQEKGTT